MCGIAGFIATTPQSARIIVWMTDIIRHRGPDDEGFVLFPELSSLSRVYGGLDTPDVAYQLTTAYTPQEKLCGLSDDPVTLALGHRRLSIVDLSPLGHQPMSSADGRYWIVYNGEVYNHIELRAELEKKGYCFVSHSDTEVILAAYSEWGKECLQRFNGMFALLIYDSKEKKLFAARDRFGVKPLYYRVSASGIAFASEIKQFTVLPDWRAQMNSQRVYDFLNWGITDHTDETLFRGVFQLRGGEALELDVQAILDRRICYTVAGKLPVYSWYQLKPKSFSGTFEDAARAFHDKLTDSVKIRLRSDVPVGSCLSGGLDSSSIVCIANQLLRKKNAQLQQKTFSACADVAKFDERSWIDTVVTVTGVDGHYTYPVLHELFDVLPTITWHQDEPFGSTSIYAQWQVFRLAASEKVKVMLDGQGADEQLAGYQNFFGPYLATLFRSLRWSTLFKEASAMRSIHTISYTKAIISIASTLLPERIKHSLRNFASRTVISPTWLNVQQLGCIPDNPFQDIGANDAKTVQALSIAQLSASNLQMLLHWEDRDSMGHSIESRVPFLDYRVVEFVLGLPDDYKLSGGNTKRVLRQGMSGLLPDAIRDRMDKLGFVTPEEIWLRETDPDLFREKIIQAIAASGGILRKQETIAMLEETISGKIPFSFLPWRIISFGEWMKLFEMENKLYSIIDE
jgi:asparagine synthase (glutamine-hydrolysing)